MMAMQVRNLIVLLSCQLISSTGTVMYYFGWLTLMWLPVPILIGFAAALVLVRKDPALRRKRMAGQKL